MAVTYNLRDGELKLLDYNAATLTVALDEGDLRIDIPERDVIEVYDRGAIDHLRRGDDKPMDVSFSIKFQEFVGSSTGVYEFLTGTGGAVGYDYVDDSGTNDLQDSGDVNIMKLEFKITQLPTGDETVGLPEFYVRSISFEEGDEYNRISVEGRCMKMLPVIT